MTSHSYSTLERELARVCATLIIEFGCHLGGNIPTLLGLIWKRLGLWVNGLCLLVLLERIADVFVFVHGFLKFLCQLSEKWAGCYIILLWIRLFRLCFWSGTLGVVAVNLLKNWERTHITLIVPNKLGSVDTVLKEAFPTVEFGNIVMPHQLIHPFVLMSEIASASIRTIHVVVELAAFCFDRWLAAIILLVCSMLICTILAKSAEPWL